MEQEGLFRWFFIAIFVATFSISAYFRRRARRSSEIIPRVREGKFSLLLRLLFAAPIYLSFFAYMVNPDWMAWSSVILPAWLRWLAVAAGIVMLPVLYWVVSTLGRNISETVLTKDDHKLVTQGPYRWVRHPLYSVATIIFFSLGILAANWFIMVMAFLIIISIVLVVIPKEEAQLIEKFGAKYRVYMKETGRLLPHLIR
jgi:protein-S-isoprenylcysteine O-methyltransferase Ste14